MSIDLFSPLNAPIYNISLSGGLGSGVSALAAYSFGLRFRLIFADTLIEDGDLYRFNQDIAEAVEQPIIHLVDGRTPWDVFVDKKFIGNSRTAHCSQILKTDQVRKWLAANAEPDEPIVLGMDWSEMDRIERAQKNWNPRPVVSLLNRFRIGRKDYDEWLKSFGIERPRLYSFGYPHNNCGGMCVRAGQAQFATLLTTNRRRYLRHEEAQERAMQRIGPTARPFLKRTVAGNQEYLTMRQFRLLYEAGEIKVDPYDFGGCACFVDEVEELAA